MRTFLFILSCLFLGAKTIAQDTDITTLVLSPPQGFDIVADDTFSISIGIYNSGNTTIESTDSIYLTFYIDNYLITTQEGSSFLFRRPNIDSTEQVEISVGDTVVQTISLSIPETYINLFENDIICFSSELFAAGYTYPVIESDYDNNLGCNTSSNVGIIDESKPLDFYYNNNQIHVETFANSSLSIYDIYGRLHSTHTLSEGQNTLDISALPQAIYFYKIYNNKNIISSGKFIK